MENTQRVQRRSSPHDVHAEHVHEVDTAEAIMRREADSKAMTALQFEAECMEAWSDGAPLDFGQALQAIDLLKQAVQAFIDKEEL